uniref:tRNA (uracil(54)-C(5))-methyltransferase n=1 Tax=Clastoptera arizonana TaxID=38151 RepID=A0A1B6C9E3_9HEMI
MVIVTSVNFVLSFERFIKNSGYPPYLNETNPDDKGIWRLLLVRMNKKGEMMIVIMIQPVEKDPPDIDHIKNIIIEYFTKGDGKDLNIVSIYLHMDKEKTGGIVGGDKVRKPAKGVEYLWGETHLNESILGLELEVTPSFYFHCNTYGAEQLYKAVKELAAVDSETTVLDLCCGMGGMGMMLAKDCKEVFGVEVMDVNVEDAKKMAIKNGLANCEFTQGKIDDVFVQLAEKVKGKKVVPILDPPRVGITHNMIVNLRKLKEADKVIYVCSNHKLPLKNLLNLATVEPGPFDNTDPFVPTRIIPIDMSPHTLRCELVILCERLDMTKIPEPTRQAPINDAKKDIRKRRRRMTSYGGYRKIYGNGNFNRSSRINARDSLYPPPLRGALYQNQQRGFNDFSLRDSFLSSRYDNFDRYEDFSSGSRNSFFNPRRNIMDNFNPTFGNNFDQGTGFGGLSSLSGTGGLGNRSSIRGPGIGGIPSLFDAPQCPPSNFSGDVSRYSNFRRDVEDAIDSSYPQYRGNTINKFSLASAMLEREQRAYQAGLTRGLVSGATMAQQDQPRQKIRSAKRGRGSWGQGNKHNL